MGIGVVIAVIFVIVVAIIIVIGYIIYKKFTALTEVGTPLICPSDKITRGALCYDMCPSGYTSDGANGCYQDCPSGWPGTGSLMYCEKKRDYSPAKIPDACPDGYELWGGLCYKRCPAGSTRTASCTCDFGPYGGVYTNCTDTRITSRNIGDPTPEFGEGYRKTALCTIQKGGIITDCGRYGVSQVPGCPAGTEKRGALCYQVCPQGTKRNDYDLEYCSTECPSGFVDIGASCQKPSKSISVTAQSVCPGGKVKKGLLCYNQ